MRRRLALLVAASLALPALSGCAKLQARGELKKGNDFYAQEQYTKALAQFKKGLELDPEAKFAWRSVGMTALALYRPGDDKPENVQYGEDAVAGFEKYLEAYPKDEKIQDYLLSCYVNVKQLDKALAFIDKELARNDPATKAKYQTSKINILTQAGRLDEAYKLVEQTEKPEDRAPQYYTVGVNAWDKVYHEGLTLDSEGKAKMVEMGLDALKQAIDSKPDYYEAMVYYNLMLREKAKLEPDPIKQAELFAEAGAWQKKAIETRKRVLEAEEKKQQQEANQKAGEKS